MSAAGDPRRRRARYKRYTYGDQWSDLVRDSRGRLVTERDQLTASGKRPMINNLIRQLVKTIVGRYRTQAAEAGRYDDEVSKRNNLAELDSRLLEEFLISGTAVQRISREERFGSEATWVDNVDMRKFLSTVSATRGAGISSSSGSCMTLLFRRWHAASPGLAPQGRIAAQAIRLD